MVLRAGERTATEMSHFEREVPIVHPRRRINPPAHLVDYELGAPLTQRQLLPEPCQSTVQSPSTAGHNRSSSPVSFTCEQLELTVTLREMKQENADLWRQTSQLPEIISALQEMRQQNAMLHHELRTLKAKRAALLKSVTPPVSPVSSPPRSVVSPKSPQGHHPIPPPMTR